MFILRHGGRAVAHTRRGWVTSTSRQSMPWRQRKSHVCRAAHCVGWIGSGSTRQLHDDAGKLDRTKRRDGDGRGSHDDASWWTGFYPDTQHHDRWWRVLVGVELHVQLASAAKLFSEAPQQHSGTGSVHPSKLCGCTLRHGFAWCLTSPQS